MVTANDDTSPRGMIGSTEQMHQHHPGIPTRGFQRRHGEPLRTRQNRKDTSGQTVLWPNRDTAPRQRLKRRSQNRGGDSTLAEIPAHGYPDGPARLIAGTPGRRGRDGSGFCAGSTRHLFHRVEDAGLNGTSPPQSDIDRPGSGSNRHGGGTGPIVPGLTSPYLPGSAMAAATGA